MGGSGQWEQSNPFRHKENLVPPEGTGSLQELRGHV